MTINIVESKNNNNNNTIHLYSAINTNQGFAPHTAISPIAIPEHEPTVINIGHMNVVHYVSTIPYNEEVVETNLSCSNQCLRVIGNEAMEVANSR